jgi:Xaa-Pro dipeptidase
VSPQHSQIASRQRSLLDLLKDRALDAVVLNPGPSLVYFTGLHFHLSERPVVCLIAPDRPVTLVLPELESAKTRSLSYEASVHTYGEDPSSWPTSFAKVLSGLHPKSRIGVEPRSLRFLELALLRQALQEAQFESAETVVAELRSRKDEVEIDKMRRATRIAEDAVRETVGRIKRGSTERDIAAELVLQLLRHGSGTELPFQPIVSIGSNAANPHATPTDRAIEDGDLLLIDWGAAWEGYFSDLTRVFAFGSVDPKLASIAEIVRQANAAGRAAAAPGVPACEVDRAAREVIASAGFADLFTHRTGHGLGLEVHEEPYIRDDNLETLEVGMTFTVEPGIYVPDLGGARIEDDMVITRSGAESLSTIERGLVPIG